MLPFSKFFMISNFYRVALTLTTPKPSSICFNFSAASQVVWCCLSPELKGLFMVVQCCPLIGFSTFLSSGWQQAELQPDLESGMCGFLEVSVDAYYYIIMTLVMLERNLTIKIMSETRQEGRLSEAVIINPATVICVFYD